MFRSIVSAAAFALSASTVFAHATLEVQEAPVNSFYKAVMRVPHGCEGSPTLKVRIQIPDGVIAVKPMPKPGWQLETVKGSYDKSYQYFEEQLTEGVREIIWTGNLPDEYYDEFVFRGRLTDSLQAGTMLYFPTVQECEKGVDRWIEIPAAGKDPESYEYPAPGLKLLPALAE
jgi:uncharacterized protein YcnI